MSKLKITAISSACLVFVTVASLRAQQGGSQGEGSQAKILDFKFSVTTIDGREITQDDFKDKVLLVDFWGTWCATCRKAIPHLVRLYEKYKEQGLEILGLNYEQGANHFKKVKDFAKKNGITYRLALGSKEIQAQVPGFGGYPTMLFFKRGLVFDQMKVGFNDDTAEEIEDWIKEALAEPASAEKKPVVEQAKGDAGEDEDPVVEKKFLESMDGKQKLELGDGEHFRLLVLVHPRMKPSEKNIAAIKALANRHKGRLVLNFVTRGDLPGKVEGALAMKPEGLAKLRLGKAFPSYVLVSPSGGSKRATGLGLGVWSRFEALIDRRIEAFDKEQNEKKAQQQKKTQEKTPKRRKI